MNIGQLVDAEDDANVLFLSRAGKSFTNTH